jgi:YbbR domain-containing protein
MRAIRDFILENWTLKLTSILLAWILWLFVRGEPGTERVITVPLEVRIPQGMEITNERPNSVDVTVRGTIPSTWFGQAVPTCVIDMQGYSEGEHVVPLTPDNVRIPRASGLEVLKVNPARVNLVLERTISKEVPVVVTTRGNPASGFDVYGKSASPNMIIITGPRSHINRIQQISTEPVSLTGQKQTIRTLANLNIQDNSVRSTPVGPIEVRIFLGVHREPFTIARVPVHVDNNQYSVTPSRVSVELLVPKNYTGTLTPNDVSVTVSTLMLAEEKLPAKVKPEVKLVTNLDPAIIINNVEPAEITVRKIAVPERKRERR